MTIVELLVGVPYHDTTTVVCSVPRSRAHVHVIMIIGC